MKRLAGLTLAALAMGLIGAPQASAQPAGAYRQSCRDIDQNGSRLSAMCRDLSGRYVPSSLDMRSCGGSVGNANGRLVCDSGARRQRDDDDDGYGRRERRRSSPEDDYRRPRY